jgi:four helix bundle protein
MNRINTYNELIIWQKSVEIVAQVLKVTEQIPDEGSCGLAHQLTKTAIAIPCNIAEGWGRETAGSYVFFLRVARAALMESQALIKTGHELKLIDRGQLYLLQHKTIELNNMLSTIIQKSKNKRINKY